MTNAASPTESQKTAPVPRVAWTATGTTSAAAIEATETMRVTTTSSTQTRSPTRKAAGASARKTPALVATPFPPLNRT